MKKLIFGLIAIVMLGFVGNAQESKKKIACVTLSCCGAGIFGVEIWSHRICIYVDGRQNTSGNDYTIEFDAPKVPPYIELQADRYLGAKDDRGNYLVLPKGRYQVVDNKISFTNVPDNSKFSCFVITFHHAGQLLGHEYEFNTYLFVCSAWRIANTGIITMDLKPNEEQLVALRNANYEVEFSDDINLENTDANKGLVFKTVVKAGKYKTDENGVIVIDYMKLYK